MNKYIIVSFLQGEFPLKFISSEWPLHITIVRPFFSNQSADKFIKALQNVSSYTLSISTIGKSREKFGHNGDIPVTELENVPALQTLHNQIMSVLGEWMEFRTPQHRTYRPHVTDQIAGKISVGEKVVIDSVSLVELNANKRTILATVNFQS